MEKIIFFDIDGTLFNPRLFLENFYGKLLGRFDLGSSAMQKLDTIYGESNPKGYFETSLFLEKIHQTYSQVNPVELENLFWDKDLINDSLFSDAQGIRELADLATFAIFSKGEEKFQRSKLSFISDLIKEENMYIFTDKIQHIPEVVSRYSSHELTFVDDNQEVLDAIKKATTDAKIILIDRQDNLEDNVGNLKIKSLDELKDLI